MSRTIDFYFDFSSPYGYLASTQIDALGARHGVAVRWRPFLLGAVFKTTGSVPLSAVPLKNEYFRHDMERSARLYGVPYKFPPAFPFGTTTACRAFYALDRDRPDDAIRLAKALYAAAFGQGRDIAPVEAVVSVAMEAGFEGGMIEAGIHDQAAKARLREVTDGATAAGIFGSPFFVVDNEPFWGADRMDQLERWLTEGGW